MVAKKTSLSLCLFILMTGTEAWSAATEVSGLSPRKGKVRVAKWYLVK